MTRRSEVIAVETVELADLVRELLECLAVMVVTVHAMRFEEQVQHLMRHRRQEHVVAGDVLG